MITMITTMLWNEIEINTLEAHRETEGKYLSYGIRFLVKKITLCVRGK